MPLVYVSRAAPASRRCPLVDWPAIDCRRPGVYHRANSRVGVARIEPPLLTLASTSPRRRELLTLLGLPFDIRPADVCEDPLAGESPYDMVLRLSLVKVSHAARTPGPRFVLGSDTTVSLSEGGHWRVFGKPLDREDACSMLLALGGRQHWVHTGFALLDREKLRFEKGVEVSSVSLRSLGVEEMEEYLASGIPNDKAGAYAVQDQRFRLVTGIEGCVASVMGLPLAQLGAALLKVGLPVADIQTVAAGCSRLTGVSCCLADGASGWRQE